MNPAFARRDPPYSGSRRDRGPWRRHRRPQPRYRREQKARRRPERRRLGRPGHPDAQLLLVPHCGVVASFGGPHCDVYETGAATRMLCQPEPLGRRLL